MKYTLIALIFRYPPCWASSFESSKWLNLGFSVPIKILAGGFKAIIIIIILMFTSAQTPIYMVIIDYSIIQRFTLSHMSALGFLRIGFTSVWGFSSEYKGCRGSGSSIIDGGFGFPSHCGPLKCCLSSSSLCLVFHEMILPPQIIWIHISWVPVSIINFYWLFCTPFH